MKISKGTIVRTALVAIVVINLVLKQFGIDLINISESEINSFVEMVFNIVTILLAFWKNNSFSQKAIEADAWLHNHIDFESESEE